MSTEVASLEITSISRIGSIPVIEFILERLRELARERIELVRGKTPELKLPAIPEKIQALPALASEYTAIARERVTERVTPWVAAVDAFANAQLDRAENKFEFFFKAPADEVLEFAQERRLELTEKAKVVFEEKVKVPAIAIGKDLDLRSKSLVDYVEARTEVPQTDAEYQYQRALNISKNLTDKGVVYSTEQLKQLKEKNTLVARAAEKAQTVAATASATAATVPARVQELKERYADVEKLKEISASVTVQIKERAQTLPPPPRNVAEAKELSLKIVADVKERAQKIPPPPPALVEAIAKLAPLFAELRELAKEEAPLKERALRSGKLVVDRFGPEAEIVKTHATEIFVQARARFVPAQTA